MTDVTTTPTRQPKSTVNGWVVLIVGSFVAFLVGAGTQLGAYLLFGLCMEADEAACEPGTLPTDFEWALATVPTYLIWLVPAAIAGLLGWRALKSGNAAGRVLMAVAAVVALLVTLACTAMWWL